MTKGQKSVRIEKKKSKNKRVFRIRRFLHYDRVQTLSLIHIFLKNFFVIIGILIAMLFLNYELTLMVLCFVPFIVLLSLIHI